MTNPSHPAGRPRPARDYVRVLDRLPHPARVSTEEMMQAVADGLWDLFSTKGVSWIGFYTYSKSRPSEMILGPRRDKPACSPIGLHGACGQCLRAARPLVVRDVASLGANYVACDPRDRSEVVVPLLNPDGSAWAVLDGDSHDVDAFDTFDALALWRLLRHVGLSAHANEEPSDVLVR
ncbi:MAG: GAF domain-containing protein [Phycisphaerales bacterium]